MKTHYDPYPEEFAPDHTLCKMPIGDVYYSTTVWNRVDCKRCLKNRNKIDKWVEETEATIIKQMGEMADMHEGD